MFAKIIVTIFFLFIVWTCSRSTSPNEMYKNVPAEMLMKNAIIKFPWPINMLPEINPSTLTQPCNMIIIVVVFLEYPSFW